MIQSNSSKYLDYITDKFQSFSEEILPTYIGKNICDQIKTDDKQEIFKHQEFLINYMKNLNNIPENKLKQRGLLVFHRMGSGKTFSAISMAEVSREYKLSNDNSIYKTKNKYQRKVIIMITANTYFEPWIAELSSKCFENCNLKRELKKLLKELKRLKSSDKKIKTEVTKLLEKYDYYFIFYNAHTLDGGWRDKINLIPNRKITGDKYTNIESNRINPFDDSFVIIDEFHNLINMFTTKIEENNRDETYLLYEKLLYAQNMRIVGLTGTPIVNKPFEIALIGNLIRGPIKNNPNIKFDLDIDNFNNLFFTKDMLNLKNEKMLKRRLSGIVSYYRGINKNVFADKVEDKVLVPFSLEQEKGYNIAERLERKRRKDNNKSISLFKIKASNVVYPSYIFNNNSLQKRNLTKNGKTINVNAIENNNRLLDVSVTQEMEKKIFKILDNDNKPLHIDNDLYKISKKVYNIIKRGIESNGPVLIFSRFEGAFGIKFITEVLKQNGYTDYDKKGKKKSNGKYMIWTGKYRNNNTKEIFNSIENKNGDIIKFFCMTTSGKEGINLLGIRQIHLLEPWWNNVVERQVIARGIRICSHSHIEEENFIDYRLDQTNRVDNTRLVNVFKYYAYIDMRDKYKRMKNLKSKKELIQFKKSIINDMEQSSIDHIIMKIANKKYKQEQLIVNILKDVAIDCMINKKRNLNENICYVDSKYNDYFNSWNIKDDYLPEKNNYNLKVIKKNKNVYLKDNDNNIYTDLEKNNIVEKSIHNNNILKIGKLVNNELHYDEQYKKNLDINIEEKIIVKNKFKILLEDTLKHNILTKKIVDLTNFNNNTLLFKDIFKKLDIILFNNIKDRNVLKNLLKLRKVSIKKYSSLKNIPKTKVDYINIDPSINIEYSLEKLCNKLRKYCRYILIDLNNYNINMNELMNDSFFDNKNKILVLNTSILKNSLMEFLDNNFSDKDIPDIINNLIKLKINTKKDLKKVVLSNDFINLNHVIDNKLVLKINKLISEMYKEKIIKEETDCEKWRNNTTINPKTGRKIKKYGPMYNKYLETCEGIIVKKEKKKDKKEKGSIKDDCMSYTIKEIKKSNEYKNLPKEVNKSKLKKKELCKEISKN